MRRLIVLYFAVIALTVNLFGNKSQADQEGAGEKQFLKHWKLESSTVANQPGSLISTEGFSDSTWVRAEVPVTVLRALVCAGVYPDPHFDLNDLQIPDASDILNQRLGLSVHSHIRHNPNPFRDPYWFRTGFYIPEQHRGDKIWLNFDGINYRADVWLNGKLVADAEKMAGMFRRFRYDITDMVNANGKNILAVRIHQVDHVGTPDPGYVFDVFGPQRGQGTDIFKDVTLKFSAGWDCAPVVRDRNMGIYQDVYLSYSGDVNITDPYVVTDLPLPDTTLAKVTVSAGLKNSGHGMVKGILRGSIDLVREVDFFSYKKKIEGGLQTITFEKEVEVPAGQTVDVTFAPSCYPELEIRNPYLWWPNGYGKQYLHNLKLIFTVKGSNSDVQNITFGIRKFTTSLKELNGDFGRVFYVNGKRIFCRGGWIQPDMMLDMNPERMYKEARLLAEANVNMIACEDMPSPPDYLMDIYDKYGLLNWETFYQCWTSYPGTPTFANPLDTRLSLDNSFDIVTRYRNHPSLILWAGACETIMREELYVPLREYIRKMDSTRLFLATSSYDWNIDSLTPYMKADLPTGVTDDGPPDYTWYPHSYYYDMVLKVKKQMFRDELGVPAVPVASSMRKFIFDLGKGEKNDIYPLDKKWAYHDAWDGEGYAFKAYDKAIRKQFGKPASAEEYIRNAQYINGGSYRAMFEAANHRMWDITSGVMIWKLNATWPQVLWQLYDWFLTPNAAYYFTRRALEKIHIQMNENDQTVSVINASHKSYDKLTAFVRVIDFNMKTLWQKNEQFRMEPDRYRELFTIPTLTFTTPVCFVKLVLKSPDGTILSDNFYWISSDKENPDFSCLTRMKKPGLVLSNRLSYDGDEGVMSVSVKNPGKQLAFFKRLIITRGEGGEELQPVFWSDNFFTLLPGEEKNLTARFLKKDLGDKIPFLLLDKDY